MKETTDLTFQQDIKQDQLTILDFYTEWCSPCEQLMPVLESLSKQYSNVNILKVKANENKQLTKRFMVRGIPALIFLKNNDVLEIVNGYKPEEDLKSIIQKFI